jgi:Aminoglycoside/hydroxyurea antibiotic resistance kinase
VTVTWDDLPDSVRATVQQHFGPAVEAIEIAAGQSSDLSTVLRNHSGQPVFLKGVRGRSRRMRWLRNEITVGALAQGIAPEVLFHADVEDEDGVDWLVVAFEHVSGRAASLAPDSPDLPLVASVVEKISAVSAPELRPLRDRWDDTDWWDKLAAEAPDVVQGWDVDEMTRWSASVPELVNGDRLLHTDLHGEQFLLGAEGSIHVIDWGLPGSGAAWVDTAFLVLRLIGAGHHPEQAEAWARGLECFSRVDNETLTAFAVYVAGLWGYWAATDTERGANHRARLARDYAAWRLAQPSTG